MSVYAWKTYLPPSDALFGASQQKSRTLYVGPAVAEESTRARRVPAPSPLNVPGNRPACVAPVGNLVGPPPVLAVPPSRRVSGFPPFLPHPIPWSAARRGSLRHFAAPLGLLSSSSPSRGPLRHFAVSLGLLSPRSSHPCEIRFSPLPVLLPPLSPAAGDSALPHSPRDSPSIRVGPYPSPSQLRAGCACGALPDPLGRPRLPFAAGSSTPASLLLDVDVVTVKS